jgi:hypothetical protein
MDSCVVSFATKSIDGIDLTRVLCQPVTLAEVRTVLRGALFSTWNRVQSSIPAMGTAQFIPEPSCSA